MSPRRARFVLLAVVTAAAPACGTPRPAWMPPPGAAAPARAPARPAPRPAAPPPPLAPTFAENRGRLPWPVHGIVVGAFGTRVEPEYGTRTQAPGIDIATAPAEPVTAVFSGVVSRVGTIAAYGSYVMLRHGAFTTVYGNLSGVNVQQGQHVHTGEAIALAGTDQERRGAGLFFAVFEGESAVDPLMWLGLPRRGPRPP